MIICFPWLFFKIVSSILGALLFSINFRIILLRSIKNPVAILIEPDLNLQINLKRIDILMLSLLLHDHWISLHFEVPFFESFYFSVVMDSREDGNVVQRHPCTVHPFSHSGYLWVFFFLHSFIEQQLIYRKLDIFNVYTLMSLKICIYLWLSPQSGDKHIYHLSKFPSAPFCVCCFMVRNFTWDLPLNKFLGVKCWIVDYRHNVVLQISRTYLSGLTETLYQQLHLI